MVQAQIKITERTNRVLSIVKAKYGLPDKSAAINLVVTHYEEEALEPELRPEFAKRLRRSLKEPTIPIADFARHYGVKRVRS